MIIDGYKNEADFMINKMMEFFKVNNYRELAEKIDTTQQLISGWKLRNATKAINNKLHELEIYDEIFGDADFNTVMIKQGKKSKAAGRDFNEKIDKVNTMFDSLTLELIKKLIDKYGSEADLQKKLMELVIKD